MTDKLRKKNPLESSFRKEQKFSLFRTCIYTNSNCHLYYYFIIPPIIIYVICLMCV